MTRIFPALGWALMMILLALLARFGWADRDAVITLLMIVPLLAVVTMRRGVGCPAVGKA